MSGHSRKLKDICPLSREWDSLEMFNTISPYLWQVESFKQQLLEPPLAAWVRPRSVGMCWPALALMSGPCHSWKVEVVQSECSTVSVFVGKPIP